MNNELPKHMPVQMAIAPDQKPYEHTYVIHTTKNDKLAQHSLSPEKLGIVGYVKDVAGFVKDAVHDHREKKAAARRNSASSSVDDERRRFFVEQPSSTPFADAITGLFPGVNTNVNAAGCTHADDLRSQMMHINNEEASHTNKLL